MDTRFCFPSTIEKNAVETTNQKPLFFLQRHLPIKMVSSFILLASVGCINAQLISTVESVQNVSV